MKGIVVKIISFEYYVRDLNTHEIVLCRGRGKLKRDGDIFVGDSVEYKWIKNDEYTIESIYPRKSSLIRPYVANIDLNIIVLAPVPKPDFLLADKLVINSIKNDIKPVICINKLDMISQEEAKVWAAQYPGIDNIFVSALAGEGIEELIEFMRGKLSCFSGQSAVGKTSILNTITGSNYAVGSLSKIERGKHTTRHTEIYEIAQDTYVVDTCGFSLLELDTESSKLRLYYPKYVELSGGCKFNGCTHTIEPDCAIAAEVKSGNLSPERYERYIQLCKTAEYNEKIKNKKEKLWNKKNKRDKKNG